MSILVEYSEGSNEQEEGEGEEENGALKRHISSDESDSDEPAKKKTKLPSVDDLFEQQNPTFLAPPINARPVAVAYGDDDEGEGEEEEEEDGGGTKGALTNEAWLKRTKGKDWNCPKPGCFEENWASRRYCRSCGTRHPKLRKEEDPLQGKLGNDALGRVRRAIIRQMEDQRRVIASWACENCDARNSGERCRKCKRPKGAPPDFIRGLWVCGCGYENRKGREKCGRCGGFEWDAPEAAAEDGNDGPSSL